MSLLGKRKATGHSGTRRLLQSWFMTKNWEMLISPVKAKHYYSFSSISVSRLASIFQALLIFSSKFLGGASVLSRFGISLKVNILRTLSKISSAVFYDGWVWREPGHSYLFRLQLLCPHNSRTADARKFELSLFYRPQWWRRKQFVSEENQFNISGVGSN